MDPQGTASQLLALGPLLRARVGGSLSGHTVSSQDSPSSCADALSVELEEVCPDVMTWAYIQEVASSPFP